MLPSSVVVVANIYEAFFELDPISGVGLPKIC